MPQDDLKGLRARLKALLAGRRAQPEEEVLPPPPRSSQDRSPLNANEFDFGVRERPTPANPFALARTDMPEGARPTGLRYPMTTTAPAPDARGMLGAQVAMKFRGDPQTPRPESIGASLASLKGGVKAAMTTDAGLLASARSVPMPQSWRDAIDKDMERAFTDETGQALQREMAERGGGMDNPAFTAGFAAPVFAGSAIGQGTIISGVTKGLGLLTGAVAARGYAGFKAMDNILKAQRTTALGRALSEYGPGAAISAGVTAASTSPDDETLLGRWNPIGGGKGRGAAVAEDLLMSAAPAIGGIAWDALRRRPPTRLNIDESRVAANAAMQDFSAGGGGPIPPERRLPARTGVEGVAERPDLPSGRMLTTPPPTEVSPNAMPVLTDMEAADRIRILRKRMESAKAMVGVDPLTGRHIDPTRQAVIDHQAMVTDAQARLSQEEQASIRATEAAAQAARDATNPRKMSLRDLVNQSGLRYGVGAGMGLAAGEQGEDDKVDPLTGTIAGLALAGTIKSGGVRHAFKSFSRLERAVTNLPEVMRASEVLKRLPNIASMDDIRSTGLGQLLEDAKNAQRTVTRAELLAHLAENPPTPAPLAHVHGTLPDNFVDKSASAELWTERHNNRRAVDAAQMEIARELRQRVIADGHNPNLLHGDTSRLAEDLADWSDDYPDLAQRYQTEVKDRLSRVDDLNARIDAAQASEAGEAGEIVDKHTTSRWANYVERGPRDGYRDTVLLTPETVGKTQPNASFDIGQKVSSPEFLNGKEMEVVGNHWATEDETWRLSIKDPATGRVYTTPAWTFEEQKALRTVPQPGDRSPHFKQQRDYGAHVRETDRETAGGDSVLAITERQSDNFQKLRDPANTSVYGDLENDLPPDSPEGIAARQRMGEGTAMQKTWSMDTFKTALDNAVRLGKKYVVFNTGADIFPVVAGGGAERIRFLEQQIASSQREAKTLQRKGDVPGARLFTDKVTEFQKEIEQLGKQRTGMNKFYDEDFPKLKAEWERQHPGLKLETEEITMKSFGSEADRPALERKLDEARNGARNTALRGDEAEAARYTQRAGELAEELRDLDSGGRKMLAIKVTPELKAQIEGPGQAARAIAPGAIAGAGIAADDDLSDEDKAKDFGMVALATGAGSGKARRIAALVAKKAAAAFKGVPGTPHVPSGPHGGPAPGGPMPGGGTPSSTPDMSTPGYRSPSQRGSQGPGKGTGTYKTSDYLNFEARHQELKNDPTGKAALEARTQQLLVTRGADFRERVTQADVRQAAERLGMDPEELLAAAKKRGLSPAEQLAASDVVAQNMDNIVEYNRQLADPNTHPETKAEIQRALVGLETQTNNLLWANLTERTEAGRNLAFQKIAAKRTMDPNFWLGQAQKNMGAKPVGPEQWTRINDFINAKDRMGLASYVASLVPNKNVKIAATAYKSGLLQNPATHATNIASNVGMGALETAKDLPAAGADRGLTGLLNRIIGDTGPNVQDIQRSRDFAPLATMSATAKGAKEGAAEILPTMRGEDVQLASQLGKYDQGAEVRIDTGNRVIDATVNAYLNGPFRALRASDNVFREAAFMRSLEQQRRLAGYTQPVNSIVEAVKDLPPHAIQRAVSDAEIATFQNESMLGKMGGRLKNAAASAGPAGELAAEFFLPFTKTPGAVASSVVKYSPLGLAAGTGNAIGVVAKSVEARLKAKRIAAMRGVESAETIKYNEAQLQAMLDALQSLKDKSVDQLGRGATGTTIMALGGLMAAAGMISVKPARSDRAGRDTGEVTGDPGATIDFGPLNGQIDRLSPLGNLLLLGAYAAKGYEAESTDKLIAELEAKPHRSGKEEQQLDGLKAQRDEEGTNFGAITNAATSTLGAIGSTIAEQPVFSGVKRISDALDDPKAATGKAITSQVASLIPASVGAVARVVDPQRRDPNGLKETLQARIPFASAALPAKLDALGTPIAEPLSVRVANIISPVRLSSDRTAGDTKDAKVRKMLVDLDIPLSTITKRTKQGETTADARSRQALTGQEIINRLSSEMSTIEQIAPSERGDYVKVQVQRARESANERAASAKRAASYRRANR